MYARGAVVQWNNLLASIANLIDLDSFKRAVCHSGNPNYTFSHGALKSYGFPISKAEERILIGPQFCFGDNNQSAVEFPYNQHLKTACNDIISIWCFVNGWKSDFKMITLRLSRREVSLNCSATYQRSQGARHAGQGWGLDQAYQRNEQLLQDFRGMHAKIYDELAKPPSPRFTTLEKNYWAMVKSQVPMWEQDIGIKRPKVQPQTQMSPSKQSVKGGQQKASKKQSKKKRSFFK